LLSDSDRRESYLWSKYGEHNVQSAYLNRSCKVLARERRQTEEFEYYEEGRMFV